MARVRGLNTAIAYIGRATEDKKEEAFDYIENAGARMEAEAKLKAPVDTGHLRRSIKHRVKRTNKSINVVVYTNIEYAVYVEYGTRYMAAQPFMRPVYVKYKGKIILDVNRIIGG